MSLKGRIFTLEHRLKLSQSHTGNVLSSEHRQNISRSMKSNLPRTAFKKGISPYNKKEPLSKICPECRCKFFMKPSHHGKRIHCSIDCYFKSKEPTSIEKKLYEELKKRDLLFETQKLIKGKFLVDAYIPSLNLVIEADGDYWHSLPKNISRDRSKNAYLKACGYNLLRLTETEINNGDFKVKLDL